MGQAVAQLGAMCDSCSKYVFNDMSCHSKCGETCCVLDVETHHVDVESESSSAEVSVDCCLGHARVKN